MIKKCLDTWRDEDLHSTCSLLKRSYIIYQLLEQYIFQWYLLQTAEPYLLLHRKKLNLTAHTESWQIYFSATKTSKNLGCFPHKYDQIIASKSWSNMLCSKLKWVRNFNSKYPYMYIIPKPHYKRLPDEVKFCVPIDATC